MITFVVIIKSFISFAHQNPLLLDFPLSRTFSLFRLYNNDLDSMLLFNWRHSNSSDDVRLLIADEENSSMRSIWNCYSFFASRSLQKVCLFIIMISNRERVRLVNRIGRICFAWEGKLWISDRERERKKESIREKNTRWWRSIRVKWRINRSLTNERKKYPWECEDGKKMPSVCETVWVSFMVYRDV